MNRAERPLHNYAISAEAVTKKYGATTALSEVGFRVAPGEFIALLGPNGAGKTTLLMLMGGYLAPDKGTIEVFSQPPHSLPPPERNRWGFVFQDEPGLYPELSVREHLELFSAYYQQPRNVDGLLKTLDLEHLARRNAEGLSGGERKRLELALAFLGSPELIFLDEPTTGLDPQARKTMWDYLAQMKNGGVTFVLTTHYLNEVEALADRVLVLNRGRLVFDGPPEKLKQRSAPEEAIVGGPGNTLESAYLNLLEEDDVRP
ncbi:ABC transporter ATP-binding protein [Oceanithermus sp.]